jgi:hypothetical protein
MRNISYKTFIKNLFTVINCVSLRMGSFVTVAESQMKRTGAEKSAPAVFKAFNKVYGRSDCPSCEAGRYIADHGEDV